MRILVATDSISALSSRQAGEVIASGWRSNARVSVLPIGDSGAGFVAAYGDLVGVTTSIDVTDGTTVTTARGPNASAIEVLGVNRGAGIPYERSSWPIGEAIAGALGTSRPPRLLVDLAGLWIYDAGAGMLAALGATADRPLDRGVETINGIGELDLAPARALFSETDLVGVVPAGQRDQQLLGLRGITARAGQEASVEPELMLRTDATLEAFARLASPSHAGKPGAGACGGLGFAVLALGGRLATGPGIALASREGQEGLRNTDLVVTGCSVFDFARRGGGVVTAMAEAASTVLSPCIVIAGEVLIGSREMRAMGIEAAYAVHESTLDVRHGRVNEKELASTAQRVARSWSW
jgi:glycerate 2-kinase